LLSPRNAFQRQHGQQQGPFCSLMFIALREIERCAALSEILSS
jgi:hypothetical protein